MVVIAMCPACGNAQPYPGPASHCSRCGAAFPETMTQQLARAEAKERPFLLRLSMGLCAAFVFVAVLFTALSAIGIGTYSINDEPVSAREFFVKGALPMLALAVPIGVAGYGLWDRRSWARPLLLGIAVVFWAVLVIAGFFTADVSTAEAVVDAILVAALLVVQAWYLYRKRNVRAYYAALRDEGR